jgi:hypothetical protein
MRMSGSGSGIFGSAMTGRFLNGTGGRAGGRAGGREGGSE